MVADFYPPMTYSALWTVIAVAIALALVGWGVVVWVQTRPARQRPELLPPPGWELARLKGQYFARIDEIVRLAAAGELSPRRAHQDLSVAVREFVRSASGVDAPTMTLSDLQRTGLLALAPVSDVVFRLYPVEFGPDRDVSVSDAAAVAREVVARWT